MCMNKEVAELNGGWTNTLQLLLFCNTLPLCQIKQRGINSSWQFVCFLFCFFSQLLFLLLFVLLQHCSGTLSKKRKVNSRHPSMCQNAFIGVKKKRVPKSYTDKTWPACQALKSSAGVHFLFFFFCNSAPVESSPSHLFFCGTFLPKPTVQSELSWLHSLAADVSDGAFSRHAYFGPKKHRQKHTCPAAALHHTVWPLTLPTVSVSSTVFSCTVTFGIWENSLQLPSQDFRQVFTVGFFWLCSNPGATLWRVSHHRGANMFSAGKSRVAVRRGEMMKFYWVLAALHSSALFPPLLPLLFPGAAAV